jgi:ABC-type uncharacterized transport system involved in gliding motility auxiliary subunit
MNEARRIVFHSARQIDPDQKYFERQTRRAEYGKFLSIVILLTMVIGALAVVFDLLQAPVPTLISAL